MSTVLSRQAASRLQQAYASKTTKSYNQMFLLYMALCECLAVPFDCPSVWTVILFIEFLAFNHLQYNSILNYLTAVKMKLLWFDLPAAAFDHHKVKLMLRAVKHTASHAPRFKGIFDIHTITNLLYVAAYLSDHEVYRAIYLLAFFGFMRISNLLPVSRKMFDVQKQLCRGDVIVQQDKAAIIVKWSKTIRSPSQGTFIIIPRLPGHVLCPVSALEIMFEKFPAPRNAPLFIASNGVLTQSQVRLHLAKLLHALGMNHKLYPFHTFRRSGATFAYNNHVHLQGIKRHGTWSSDAVQAYLINDSHNASMVANMFQNVLLPTNY